MARITNPLLRSTDNETMIKSTITELVKADLDARTEKGIKEYGHPLSKYMGEDGLKHAYEEALDLAQYLKLRLMEEATPYQCYWKDRALRAEKKIVNILAEVDALEASLNMPACKPEDDEALAIAAKLRKLTNEPTLNEGSWAGSGASFTDFCSHLFKGAKVLIGYDSKEKAEQEERKKRIDYARQAHEKDKAEFERLKKEREAAFSYVEPVKCKSCGRFTIFRNPHEISAHLWESHCGPGGRACTKAKGHTIHECIINWNKSNA